MAESLLGVRSLQRLQCGPDPKLPNQQNEIVLEEEASRRVSGII